jgi:hypothetical protein
MDIGSARPAAASSVWVSMVGACPCIAVALRIAIFLHISNAQLQRQVDISESCQKQLTDLGKDGAALAHCIGTACLNSTNVVGSTTPSKVGTVCADCFATLCRNTEGGTEATELDFEATEFECSLSASLTKSSGTAPIEATLNVATCVFPAACAVNEVLALMEIQVVGALTTDGQTASASADCDIFASIVNENFAWLVLAGAAALFALSWLLSYAQCCKALLRVSAFSFVVLDVIVGVALVIFGVVLAQKSNFPPYLVVTVMGMAAVQLLTAVVIFCGAKRNGTVCLLCVSYLLTGLVGVLALALGLAFQFGGKTWLQDGLGELGVSLSEADALDLAQFMQNANSVIVCMLFLMAGVNLATSAQPARLPFKFSLLRTYRNG